MSKEELKEIAKQLECYGTKSDNLEYCLVQRQPIIKLLNYVIILQQKIDKAIEYINKNSYLVQDKEINGVPLMSLRLDKCYDLLEILGEKE